MGIGQAPGDIVDNSGAQYGIGCWNWTSFYWDEREGGMREYLDWVSELRMVLAFWQCPRNPREDIGRRGTRDLRERRSV